LSKNFDPKKHVEKFLNMKDILAPGWAKKTPKEMEKLILGEWKKLVGMTESNAKYRYVQLCRSLKTYGITTYLVKEPVKKKKGKLQPVLVGITRDSVLKMDPETKEVILQWPLTHLRRWAAGEKTFTMDFGDYEDGYFSVSTLDGEAISQQIAGYIDIILKKRRDAPKVEMDDDTDLAIEQEVAPAMAQISMSYSSPMVQGGWDPNNPRLQILNPAQQGSALQGAAVGQMVPSLGPDSQTTFQKEGVLGSQMPITDLDSALAATNDLLNCLDAPDLGLRIPSDLPPDALRRQFVMSCNAVNQGCGVLVNAAMRGNLDQGNLDQLASQLGLDLGALVNNARLSMPEGDDDDISLLLASKAAAEAISKILQVTKDLAQNPDSKQARFAMRQAQECCKAAFAHLAAAQQGVLADQASQDLLMATAQLVSGAATDIYNVAMHAAKAVEDPNKRKALQMQAAAAAAATASLMQIAKLGGPAVTQPAFRSQLLETSNNVGKQSFGVLTSYKDNVDDQVHMSRLTSSAKDLKDGIAQLLAAAAAASFAGANPSQFLESSRAISEQVARLISAKEAEVCSGCLKAIAGHVNHVVSCGKLLAPEGDPDLQARFVSSGQDLRSQTAQLVNQAKVALANPSNIQARKAMEGGAQDVAQIATAFIGDVGKYVAVLGLAQAAKQASSAVSSLIAANRSAATKVGSADPTIASSMLKSCRDASEATNKLVASLATLSKEPGNPGSHAQLVEASKKGAHPCMGLVSVSKSSAPKVPDPNVKIQLVKSADAAGKALQGLVAAMQTVELMGGNAEVQEAIEKLEGMQAELDTALLAVDSGVLTGIPGQSRNEALDLLNIAVQNASKENAQVAASTGSADKLARATGEAANAFESVVEAAKAVAGATQDKQGQKKLINAAKEFTDDASGLFEAAKSACVNPGDKELRKAVQSSSATVEDSLAKVSNAARGLNTADIDAACALIKSQKSHLAAPGGPPSGNLAEAAEGLQSTARALSAATNQVSSAARSNPQTLGKAAKMVSTTVAPFVQAVNAVAGASEESSRKAIVQEGDTYLKSLIQVLEAAKAAALDKNERDGLTKSMKPLSDSLNKLLTLAAPGAKELAEALNNINNALKVVAKLSAMGRKVPLDSLVKAARTLADSIAQLVVAARTSPEKLGGLSQRIAESLDDIISLVTTEGKDQKEKETEKEPEKPSVPPQEEIDLSKFVQAAQQINSSLATIREDPKNKNQVVGAAKQVIAGTNSLLGSAKEITSPAAKQKLAGSTTKLHGSTQAFAAALKAAVSGQPGGDEKFNQSINDLEAALKDLMKDLPRKAEPSKPSKPSSKEVTKSQDQSTVGLTPVPTKEGEQMLTQLRSITSETSNILSASSEVCTHPKDTDAQIQLSSASTACGEAIRKFIDLATGLTPGAKDCSEAMEQITNALSDLEVAAMAAAFGDIEPEGNHSECLNQMRQTCKELTSGVTNLIKNKTSPVAVGDACKTIGAVLPKLVAHVNAASASSSNSGFRNELLSLAKTLANSLLNMVNVAKQSVAKPSDTNLHRDLDTRAKVVSTALAALLQAKDPGAGSIEDFDNAASSIKSGIVSLKKPGPQPNKPYNHYKNETTKLSRDVLVTVQKLTNGVKTHASMQHHTANVTHLTTTLPKLFSASRSAMDASTDPNIQQQILDSASQVGQSVIDLLNSAKQAVENENHAGAQEGLAQSLTTTSASISSLIASMKGGAIGERECEAARLTLDNVSADLDACALLAAGGELATEITSDVSYEDSERALLKSAKALVEAAQDLASTDPSQEKIAQYAKALASCGVTLGDNTKIVSAQIPDVMAQQEILTSAKGACMASHQLVGLARDFAVGQAETPQLKAASDKVQEAISQLENIAETAAAEATKGLKSIEKAQTVINKELTKYRNPSTYVGNLDADWSTMGEAVRSVSAANAHLVAATTQDQVQQVVTSATEVSESIVQLLQNSKGAASNADPKVTKELNNISIEISSSILDLLESAKGKSHDLEARKKISEASGHVVDKINDIVSVIRKLPGAEKFALVEDFGEDLDELAHKELRAAAAAIEAAAKSLLNASAVPNTNADGVDLSEVTDAILDAARAIAGATAILVKAASVAQSERVSAGKNPKTKHLYKKDPTWSNGLISAAKAVAANTQQLVNVANGAVGGSADQADLVASAKGVMAATAQLVAASRAKADPFSESQKRLSEASKAVAKATGALVEAAKIATQRTEEKKQREKQQQAYSLTDAQRLKMERQARILRLEQELERERQEVKHLNQAGYQ